MTERENALFIMYLFGQFNLHIISNKKKVSQARKDRAITNNENFERVSFSSKDRKYSTKIFLIEMIIVLFISHDQLYQIFDRE